MMRAERSHGRVAIGRGRPAGHRYAPLISASALLLVLASACRSGDGRRAETPTATGPPPAATCRDLTYISEGTSIRATLCEPAGEGADLPAVLVLHGCGGPSPALEAGVGRGLAEQGFVTLSVAYFGQTRAPGRVTGSSCGALELPEDALLSIGTIWLRHLTDGVSLLQAMPRVDGRRIGVVGWSLGGGVALGAALLEPRLRAVVVYAGALPPILHPQAGELPPVLMLHGDADDQVDVGGAYTLRDLLQEAGVAHELHIYPGGSHLFWNEREAADARARTVAFLQRYLAP
jgi:carboxymethylenebutenolidase